MPIRYNPYTGEVTRYGEGPEHRYFDENYGQLPAETPAPSALEIAALSSESPAGSPHSYAGLYGGGGDGYSGSPSDPTGRGTVSNDMGDWGERSMSYSMPSLSTLGGGVLSGLPGIVAALASGITSSYDMTPQAVDKYGAYNGKTSFPTQAGLVNALNARANSMMDADGSWGGAISAADIGTPSDPDSIGVGGAADGAAPDAGGFGRDPDGGYADGGGVLSRYVPEGPGDGRSDMIEARLSPNEYVIDAETVALLGDGNPDAGAAKLDKMREEIRRHKGGALANGRISPDARSGALDYIGA